MDEGTKDTGLNSQPTVSIHRGKKSHARRVLLYGPGGVGKSTWAAGAWKPLFLKCENGVDDLDVASVPIEGAYKTWPQFFSDLQELCNNPPLYDFSTLVIDSLDWLEKIIWQDICAAHGQSDISEFSWGKGYGLASQHWRKVIKTLDLARENGIFVVLLAHSKIERFESPDTDSFDRYSVNLDKRAAAICVEWVDECLFANFRTAVRESGEGVHKKKKGIGTGRYLLTTNRPTAVAKSRLQMPDEIDLSFAAYAEHVTKNES